MSLRRSQRATTSAAGGGAAADASTSGDAVTAAGSDAPPAVATPATTGRKQRAPPQDIGIPQLLLLGGGQAAAAGADAVDAAPLGVVGFTPDTLRAGCDFLRQADPSARQPIRAGTCCRLLHAGCARWHKFSTPLSPCPAELAPLIDALGPPDRLLRKGGNNFPTIAKAIVFQASSGWGGWAAMPAHRLLPPSAGGEHGPPSLCSAFPCSQQLATKAAATIYGRVLAACGCTDILTPQVRCLWLQSCLQRGCDAPWSRAAPVLGGACCSPFPACSSHAAPACRLCWQRPWRACVVPASPSARRELAVWGPAAACPRPARWWFPRFSAYIPPPATPQPPCCTPTHPPYHQQASYILDLAAHFADGRLSDARIEGLGEAALERELTAIKGIGVWTCQMVGAGWAGVLHASGWQGVLAVLCQRWRAGAHGLAPASQALHLHPHPDAARNVPPRLSRRAAHWRPGGAARHAAPVRPQGALPTP